MAIKGGRFCFWVMDLNPDEAIAAGWLQDNTITAKALKQMLNFSLKRADRTIVLDRFMQQRILEKGVDPARVSIVPPWSHDDAVSYSVEGRNVFRSKHGLNGKFVVMYSGNHSPCHPLDTLFEAALILAPDDRFLFCFVGGGSEQTRVREFAESRQLRNIKCLPYEPIDALAGSLSAADLHVVVMGEKFVGIVHPCKVYNILNIGVPLLYIGPTPSHVTDISESKSAEQITCVSCGDVKQVVEAIQSSSHKTIQSSTTFSKKNLLPKMIALLELSNDDQRLFEAGLLPDPQKPNDTQAQEVVL